jgi:protein-S-isoprenylcysteine O-methyltransferase Ste14
VTASVIWIYLIDIPWVVFVAYWAIAALRTRRTESRESALARYSIMAVLLAGYALVFVEKARVGVLGERVGPASSVLAATGLVLTWLGIALALWARWHLGQYWSGRITIKEGHQLIRTGPYARFRHPIYSGLDLATIGTAMIFDQWGAFVGVALVIGAYWIKARREEAMLSARFGDGFHEHCRHTGFLFPKFG